MNKINSSLFGNHDIALASFIDSQMRKMHLDLSPAQREGLFEAAKQFHNSRAGQEMCNAIINDTGTSNK
ncbi:hypothetical protein ABGV49_12745 [Chromobacterium vaccinii]|uniref:Uncharacterized protein n=1 Tax=Chromobacterium vaccinii TaxID=1108595 RepID=A0ABV0FCW5_9NEIS